ncbi:hypothetical protein C6361_34305 [Plantactinospora sp. BC1]|nr:hypothetical protein C6361_34305 [Plantactinospora sp. BC1]
MQAGGDVVERADSWSVGGSGHRSGPARTGESGDRVFRPGQGRTYRGPVLAPDPDHVRTPDQFVAALNAAATPERTILG